MRYESGFSGVFVYPKLTCTYSYLLCQTSDEAHDNPDTYFSDPVDIASSDVESFDEDDMYGLDSAWKWSVSLRMMKVKWRYQSQPKKGWYVAADF
jgi:hypothetical protein